MSHAQQMQNTVIQEKKKKEKKGTKRNPFRELIIKNIYILMCLIQCASSAGIIEGSCKSSLLRSRNIYPHFCRRAFQISVVLNNVHTALVSLFAHPG